MDLPTYRELRQHARRYANRTDEAEDLVQDALLAALQADRHDMPWLIGVLQRQAAMAARTAARRKQRESRADDLHESGQEASLSVTHAQDSTRAVLAQLLDRLAPAARRVAVLALHGLNAEEIRWILDITAEAFRQRLSSIRKALGGLSPELRAESLALAYVRNPVRSLDLEFGLVRRSLHAALAGGAGLGTHDPDGHLLIIRRDAHVFAPRGNKQVMGDRVGSDRSD
ncbi:RNA polymerase sigma factor [Arenimonas sp.]|uniref:RNA polymerase sigma factor n=1 Tax=Arenimonas sp. TaxID=1872635 RepID=UPI0039E613F5